MKPENQNKCSFIEIWNNISDEKKLISGGLLLATLWAIQAFSVK